MASIKKLIVLLFIFSQSVTLAAIDCRPGLGNCPNEPGTSGESIPPVTNNQVTVAIGYFEIPSPDCNLDDKELAIQEAKNKALLEAKHILGSDEVVRTSNFRIFQECKAGIYANSSKGLSWIIQAFANYRIK